MSDEEKRRLRSQAWFEGRGARNFANRGWVRSRGVPMDHFDGRPVIGICNTCLLYTSPSPRD